MTELPLASYSTPQVNKTLKQQRNIWKADTQAAAGVVKTIAH